MLGAHCHSALTQHDLVLAMVASRQISILVEIDLGKTEHIRLAELSIPVSTIQSRKAIVKGGENLVRERKDEKSKDSFTE
jgi:hypothetical protein